MGGHEGRDRAAAPAAHRLGTVFAGAFTAAVSGVAAGVIGWVWSGDWRWVVTGLLVGFFVLLIGAALDRR